MCTEAEHLSEIYDDYEANISYAEYMAEREFERLHTIANLAGIDTATHSHRKRHRLKKNNKNLYLVIQDSRKDNTTLMLVDRRKSKKYWWTHDFSIAYKGKKEDMENVVKKLRKNNVRVVSYKSYFNSL
jgi:hypothetical protein|nr:MAG TPA: hypothetical protein [Caudoviricetes sp.]